jgi:opacity protein-like surface antigen
MTRKGILLGLLILAVLIPSTYGRAVAEEPVAEEPATEQTATVLTTNRPRNTLRVKGGRFYPATADIIGVPFDAASGVAWSIAFESRIVSPGNLSFDISLDGATNDLTLLDIPASELSTVALMCDLRYYINLSERAALFAGGGLGILSTDLTIPTYYTVESYGVGVQLLGGVDLYLSDNFSVGVEGKYLFAKPEDAVGDYIDISGPALLGTVGLHF